MMRKLERCWEDEKFLAMLDTYEHELQSIDPHYPVGQTTTFLDVEGIDTFVYEHDGEYLGLLVLGFKK